MRVTRPFALILVIVWMATVVTVWSQAEVGISRVPNPPGDLANLPGDLAAVALPT